MITARELRRRFPAAFEVRPSIYWCDMLGAAALGWGAFAAAARAEPASLACAGLLALAVLALYRAVLFIHELTHLRRGAVPGFELAWNLLVGLPLMVPSLMYVGSHLDHHRRDFYGTPKDPEYEPIAHWRPLRIVAASLVLAAVPALLVVRWGLLGPVSWLVPPLRRLVTRRASTLVINGAYQRRAPVGRESRRWMLQETGAALLCWAGAAGLATGWLPLHVLGLWYVSGAAILLLNHVRTLAAHRYENVGEPLDTEAQLRDSVNVLGHPWLTALAAPVGLRFHALHHLAPSLPYHSLGRVHCRLAAELPGDTPYRQSEAPGILHAVRALFGRASRNSRCAVEPAADAERLHA